MVDRVKQAKDLLIEQYKESTDLNGFIDAFSTEMQAVDDTTYDLLVKRSLDTAVGENLNVLGRIIVLDRPFTDPDPEEVFTFENAGNIGGGYTNEDNTTVGGYWIGLDPIENQKYNDNAYRFILRAKIIFNTTICTIEDMHRYAEFVFNAESLIFERPGVIDLNIARPVGRQERLIIDETFPLAAGIRIGTISFSSEAGAFGFDNQTNGGFGDLNDTAVGGVFSTLIVD